jgi:hypothetical protein
MSTSTNKRIDFISLLLLGILSACSLLNPKTTIANTPEATGISRTPVMNPENNPNKCRIREELPLSEVETVNMPEVNVQALLEQDQNLPKDAPLRFATSIAVKISPGMQGNWETVDNDIQIWRVRIVSSGALSISIGFTTFNMPPGGCLFVYSPDHSTIIGPYTDQDNEEHGQLWTPIIDGEEAIVEVSVPKAAFSQLQLEIGYVNHGYR